MYAIRSYYASGTYYFRSRSAAGCWGAEGSATVTINANPTASPGFSSNPICSGSGTTLNANASAGSGSITTYSWSSGVAGNNSAGTVFSAGTYTVTVTNSNGCTVAATSPALVVNANPSASPDFTSNPICNGISTTLNANATAGSGSISGYAWSSGISGNNAGGSITSAGAYTVTVTNSNVV